MEYSTSTVQSSPDDERKLWKGERKKMRAIDTLPRGRPLHAKNGATVKKNWIQGAIKHPGRCTPITKPGCTGAARALALRFKKGGNLYKAAA